MVFYLFRYLKRIFFRILKFFIDINGNKALNNTKEIHICEFNEVLGLKRKIKINVNRKIANFLHIYVFCVYVIQ